MEYIFLELSLQSLPFSTGMKNPAHINKLKVLRREFQSKCFTQHEKILDMKQVNTSLQEILLPSIRLAGRNNFGTFDIPENSPKLLTPKKIGPTRTEIKATQQTHFHTSSYEHVGSSPFEVPSVVAVVVAAVVGKYTGLMTWCC